MKRKILSPLIILFFPLFCISQNSFVPGFVVLNSSDTLRGLINDREWNINPTKFQFKKSEQDTVMLFTPSTARSFTMINGERYFAFSDSIESSPLRITGLSEIKTPERIKDTAFVRALILGKVSLYYLRDRNSREHFLIQKNGGTITELYYKKYKYTDNNAVLAREISTYKSQLIQLLSDCESVAGTMANRSLQYDAKDLSAIIEDYIKCSGAKEYYAETKEKWQFKTTIEAGVNISKLSIKDDPASDVNGLKSGYKFGYVVGVGLDAILPRNHGRWSLYGQAMVRNFQTSFSINAVNFHINYDLIYLKLATTVHYHFVNGKMNPFLELGITNAYAVKDSHHENYAPYLLFNSFKDYEEGLVAGFGIPWKSFSLHSLFELSNGMSEAWGSTTFTTFYVELGYRF